MIAATDSYRAPPLLPFIQTLFDITLLRKGPAHIPRSSLMLLFAGLLWLLSRLATLTMLDRFDERAFGIEVISTLVSIACFASVIVVAGRSQRLLQSICALIGTSAILRMVYLAGDAMLQPMFGTYFMWYFAWAMIFWSVAFKGHIIALAIDRHWYVGLALASAITIIQFVIEI